MPPSINAMCTQAKKVRSLAKKTCVQSVVLMKSLHHGTPLYRFGVDLDGLDARLVRVAYTRFADGVVAAARAEHLFVALCSSRRVLLSLLREALLTLCVSEVRETCGEAL